MVFSLLPTAVLAADGEDPDTSAGSGQVTQQDSENLGDQADPDNQADPDVLNDSEDSDDSDALQLLGEGLGSEMSGNCGAVGSEASVQWALTQNNTDSENPTYTLTISGNGAMADYYAQYVQRASDFSGDIAPWRRALLSDPSVERTTEDVVPITEVKIGDGVTRIGSGAFAYTELTGTVTFSKNVTSYGDGVFARDTSIKAVDWTNFKPTEKIRDGWATVYEEKHIAVPYAFFDGCSSLDTSIVDGITYSGQLVLPDTIEAIYVAAFRGTGFSTVDFSDGLSSIQAVGSYAITKLANMTEFTYPGNVAFYGTNDEGQNNVIQGGGIEKLTIAKEVTELPANFCTNTEKLTAIEFESGSQLTKIGKMAFYGTQALKSIDIPSTVTSIGESAFADCFSLEKIELGQIASLEQNTFARCSSLETAKIQGSPSVIYPSNMFGTWGSGHSAAPLKTLEIGAGEIQFDLSRQKDSIETIVLGDGVTAVPARFAVGCTKLTSVSLPDALISVPAYAFNGCSSLAEVGISENSKLQSIGNGAFANSALTQIYIPKNVTSIGEGAFNRTPITVFDMSDVLADNMTVGLYAINNWYSKDEQANWPAWKDNFKYIYVSNSGAANSVKAKTSNCNYAFFVTNGGSVDATKTGFAAVYREGYTAQWFETENFTGSPVTGTPATGKTYYAKWIEHIPERPIIHYVLVQDFNYKGTGSTKWTQAADTATDPYKFNVSTGQDGDPKRENYKFLGWADESTATAAKYHAGDEIWLTRENPTKTIYAVWTPCGHDNYEWVDNGDGTHSEECTACGHKKDEKDNHYDNDGNGKCDACGADMPTPPIDPPTKPDEGSNLIAGLKVKVECTTENSGHEAKEYAVTSFPDCVIGEPAKLTDTTYTCTVTLPRAAAVAKYDEEIGTVHTDALAAEDAKVSWTLTYNEGTWTVTSDNPVTIEVTCNGSQPEVKPTKPGVLEGGVTFECENPDKTHTVFYSTTYTIQAKDYTFINDVQYDDETKQYYVLANVTLDSEYYLELFDGWTGATHRISDGQSLTLTGIRFNYEKSTAPGGVASWKQELPKPVIRVTCAEELIPVELVIYRNGDTSESYKTVRVANVKKGTVIKAADYPIGKYYDGTNSGGKYDFYGWYDDGLWNIYKRDPANPPAGLTEKTVNGWTNFKCMVYDYEKVVYFQTQEALTDYQNDHSKTDGLLYTTTARKGDTLPTTDAPTATREGYTFLHWSREGQTSDVTGQTVNGWTNLVANWEKIPDPTKENIEFNGKDTVYVKCDIYGTHAEPIAYGKGEYEIVRTSDTTANLVFTSATYLAASKYANDHALAAVSDPEVSTQIVFKDGEWQQLKNGPTVHVLCKVTLTYDAHAPEGKPVTNMPDPLKVTQTLDEGSTTTFYLSENIPACEGYVFLGWTSDTTLDVPTIPVEWKTENNGANWKTTTGYPGYTLYAVWARTYSIYYDGNGGTFTKGGKDFTHVSDNDLTLGEPHTLRENMFTREHYEFTGWAKTKEGPKDYDGGATDVTFAESDLNGKGQVRLYAQWKPVEVDVNVYITPVDSGEEDSLLVNDVKLNAATLARIGLKAYETDEDGEAIDRILVGKYASKIAAGLTEDLFGDKITTDVTDELSGFQKDADIPDAFNTNNILSNTTWTWLSVEDEENFLSGNLPLYTVRFVTEDEANVKNMPTALYSYNGAPIYDYYLKGEKVAAPTTDPSRTGYTFDGWYAQGATDKFVFTEDTVTGDLVLTAKWEAETYTITYEYNDKDIKNKKELQPKNPNSYTIEDAITLKPIEAAGEHGKQFVKWRCDLNKDGVAETITEIPKGTTGNLTISAHWNYPVNYTVFDKNGDKIDRLSNTEYVFEDVLRSEEGYKLTALTQDGYTFDGWYQDDDDLGKTEKLIEGQTLKTAKKWELYGKLTPNEYTVTFDPNAEGASVAPTSQLVTFDAAYGELPTPTREGYTFEGWYLSKTEFTPANKVEATTIVKTPGDHMLYANWAANTYTVTFNPNADDATVAPTSQLVTFDAAYGELPTPTRENYRFVGWYLNGVRVTKDTIVKTAANHTLLAGWSRSYYALTINYVDRNGKKLEKSYEASVALGADFSVTSPVVKGYKLRDKDDAVIEGTMTAEGYTYDVVYIKKSSGGSGVQIESPNKPKQDNSLRFNTEDHFAYVNGYPDGTVKPTGDVTRAEVAAILYRVMDADCVKTYETTRCSFSDVVRGDWFNLYVATLENADVIVDTRTNGKFRPNEAITRAELAAMLAQFADIKSAANSFNDVSARHWASDEIAVCAKMGWINGYPDGSFRPDATITRAEMMAMINRALGRTPKSADDLLSGMKTWRDNANVNAWYYLDVQEATNSHTYTKSGTHETWKKLR